MPEFLTKIISYAMTAGTAAVVDAGGFALLVRAGMAIPVAGLVSFGIAAVVNYLLTSRFVFGRRASVISFAVSSALNTSSVSGLPRAITHKIRGSHLLHALIAQDTSIP